MEQQRGSKTGVIVKISPHSNTRSMQTSVISKVKVSFSIEGLPQRGTGAHPRPCDPVLLCSCAPVPPRPCAHSYRPRAITHVSFLLQFSCVGNKGQIEGFRGFRRSKFENCSFLYFSTDMPLPCLLLVITSLLTVLAGYTENIKPKKYVLANPTNPNFYFPPKAGKYINRVFLIT